MKSLGTNSLAILFAFLINLSVAAQNVFDRIQIYEPDSGDFYWAGSLTKGNKLVFGGVISSMADSTQQLLLVETNANGQIQKQNRITLPPDSFFIATNLFKHKEGICFWGFGGTKKFFPGSNPIARRTHYTELVFYVLDSTNYNLKREGRISLPIAQNFSIVQARFKINPKGEIYGSAINQFIGTVEEYGYVANLCRQSALIKVNNQFELTLCLTENTIWKDTSKKYTQFLEVSESKEGKYIIANTAGDDNIYCFQYGYDFATLDSNGKEIHHSPIRFFHKSIVSGNTNFIYNRMPLSKYLDVLDNPFNPKEYLLMGNLGGLDSSYLHVSRIIPDTVIINASTGEKEVAFGPRELKLLAPQESIAKINSNFINSGAYGKSYCQTTNGNIIMGGMLNHLPFEKLATWPIPMRYPDTLSFWQFNSSLDIKQSYQYYDGNLNYLQAVVSHPDGGFFATGFSCSKDFTGLFPKRKPFAVYYNSEGNLVSGISKIDIKKFANIYPNPASDRVNIMLPNFNCKVDIINILGEPVWKVQCHEDKLEIETKNWAEGLYFIHVETPEKTTLVKKLLIHH